jgi:murein DD-endopeptidase MepM/ murein hydrolase activator NlpD
MDFRLRSLLHRIDQRLGRHLPERRLFLRSETSTSFVRLRPLTQALCLSLGSALVVWTLAATAILAVQSVGAGDIRAASLREQDYFQERLTELSAQRDRSAAEAVAAHARYAEAMDRVAAMQAAILEGDQQRAELERGIEALQASLRDLTAERDAATARLAEAAGDVLADRLIATEAQLAGAQATLDFVTTALRSTAGARELSDQTAAEIRRQVEHLALEHSLLQDRNQRIFATLERAVETSMLPLERAFRSAGINPQDILRQVRSGYQTREAALQPIAVSTMGIAEPDDDTQRANRILEALQEIDIYRIAVQRTPFAMPVRGGVTQTSGFGYRRDPRGGGRRMHTGVDWAGPTGTPIFATAAGVVVRAGRDGGYGNLVVIRHEFGIETYYAHLSSIGVRVGQRVSRGDRIGGMGSTGRSTGVHLHYEIRVGGRPINPLTYIRAMQNVL